MAASTWVATLSGQANQAMAAVSTTATKRSRVRRDTDGPLTFDCEPKFQKSPTT
jgi:hypothetical protein